jgi:predicted pyridoxine 5'-phosphate oxidase superfamily flavin-nucleotide-binding protein
VVEARVLWRVWVLDDPPARPAVTKREKDATNKCRMVCVELP